MGGLRFVIASAAVLVVMACDGGNGSEDAGTDEGTDASDVVDEDGGEPGSLTVNVVGASRTHRGYMLANTADALEGAAVALDGPDGTRSEMTTVRTAA